MHDDDGSAADGEAIGWGCDVTAWLYGRDPRGGGILATGDLGVLRLPALVPVRVAPGRARAGRGIMTGDAERR